MQSHDSRGFFVRFLREDTRCAGAGALRLALIPFAAGYGAAVRLRRAAYGRGILRSHDLGAPVISVGNLSAGGTGKTPMVEWVVRRLQQMGRRPAILSRGYGAQAGSTGQARNDEALLLERRLPGVPHYANPDRVASARRAISEGADCLVLDDGFQHLRARRNLDIVLVDALKPMRGRRLIPAGDLREPLSCLRRADAILLTRADVAEPQQLAERRAELAAIAPNVPVVEAAHRPAEVESLGGENAGGRGKACLAPTSLIGKRVLLFCGIGNPQGFLETVKRLGADVVASQFLPDHHHYSPADLGRLAALFENSGAELALTTEKDGVKLAAFPDEAVPCRGKACLAPATANADFLPRVRVLCVEMSILSGEATLDNLLRGAFA